MPLGGRAGGALVVSRSGAPLDGDGGGAGVAARASVANVYVRPFSVSGGETAVVAKPVPVKSGKNASQAGSAPAGSSTRVMSTRVHRGSRTAAS